MKIGINTPGDRWNKPKIAALATIAQPTPNRGANPGKKSRADPEFPTRQKKPTKSENPAKKSHLIEYVSTFA